MSAENYPLLNAPDHTSHLRCEFCFSAQAVTTVHGKQACGECAEAAQNLSPLERQD